VIPFERLDEAIAIQNGVTQGLSSAIFTDSLRNAERFLSHLGSDCGIANVNIGTSGAEIGGAFGLRWTRRRPADGREADSDAWKAYMRTRPPRINWGDDLPLAQGIEFSEEPKQLVRRVSGSVRRSPAPPPRARKLSAGKSATVMASEDGR
jgi:aldehyde dehydrogenase (NAD+)